MQDGRALCSYITNELLYPLIESFELTSFSWSINFGRFSSCLWPFDKIFVLIIKYDMEQVQSLRFFSEAIPIITSNPYPNVDLEIDKKDKNVVVVVVVVVVVFVAVVVVVVVVSAFSSILPFPSTSY